jgi:hypothetical protein
MHPLPCRLIACLFLLLGSLRAQTPPALVPGDAASGQGLHYAYAGVGTSTEVSEPLMQRAIRHVETHLRIMGNFRGHLPASSRTLPEIAREQASQRGPDEAMLLLFVSGVATNQAHGVIDTTNRVAVVNLDILRDANPEVEARRVEKQAIRALSFLIKVPTCPNPRCSYYQYANLAELDAISRNPCPPCGMMFGQAAAAAGLALKPQVLPEEIRRRLEEKRRKAAATNSTERATGAAP